MAASYVFGSNAERTPKEAPGAVARPRKATTDRTPCNGLSPDEQSTTECGPLPKALDLAYRARLWIDENPDAWAFIASRALHEADARRQFGVKQLVEEARRKDFAGARGRRTRVSNTLTPAFARIIVEEHPECRPFLVLKPSMLDGAL